MNRPFPRRTIRIVILVLAVVSLTGVVLKTVWTRFAQPTFTLLVIPVSPEWDPAKIVACAIGHSHERWDWLSILPANLQGAERFLWVEKVGGDTTTKLFGRYTVCGDELHFWPAAPLTPGSMYHVVFHPPGMSEAEANSSVRTGFEITSGKGKLELIHQVPEQAKTASPAVQSVHPSADVLPSNHLKFYITFSKPMEQGVFMERIKLLRGDGKEVAGPFRETELWSPDGRRLTVWLHPGRQKTGVNLNEDEGPVLRENENVTLLISGAWRSEDGQKIGADFKRMFRVGKPDHEQVEPSRWMVHPPKAGTCEPLWIEFPEPLDWALLQSSLSIVNADGSVTEGQIEIADGEEEWRFIPKIAWSAGEHHIKVSPVLEDLAGNNLERPFEVDAADARPPLPAGSMDLVFRTK